MVVGSVALGAVGRCTVPAAQLRLGGHMSVEASDSMSEVWPRWQGHVINGVFPLGRYLGCSDHSGVFLTKSATRGSSEVVVKLVPTNRALVELQLPRWKRAGRLAHPHLLRLLEWGGCQLDGLPYLYTVMEYADQTLAQLLLHRALTDDEAREMLLPTLEALAFLHGRKLVQGQLKPANILVVGDQLKLASDRIRRVSEGAMSTNTPTVYDPPEVWHEGSSTAGDIWALGVTLFEALSRRPPPGLREPREAIVLPADFSPAFRDIVARCLSPSPQDRPSVAELVDWTCGRSVGSVPAATIRPAAVVPPEPRTPEPASPRTASPQVAPEAARRAPSVAQSPKPRALLTVMVGAVAILALGWTGVRVFRTHGTPAPAAVQAAGGPLSQTPRAAARAVAEARAPVSALATTKATQSDLTTSRLALQEVIPDVARSVRRTIRGHIKVWVRVIVDQDGSVYAAVADRTGPSRYFQQLAVDAAKKWTFSPADTPSRRLMQVRFDFSRDGTTGRAVTLEN
jgi:outer membrane biosynthesis protein TonB